MLLEDLLEKAKAIDPDSVPDAEEELAEGETEVGVLSKDHIQLWGMVRHYSEEHDRALDEAKKNNEGEDGDNFKKASEYAAIHGLAFKAFWVQVVVDLGLCRVGELLTIRKGRKVAKLPERPSFDSMIRELFTGEGASVPGVQVFTFPPEGFMGPIGQA